MKERNKKLLLIINPVSGKRTARKYLVDMIDRFDDAGYAVTACCTQANKNARDITLERGQDFDMIVCVGGDGTLKQTVGAMMQKKLSVPVGFVPLGSTNDFAGSLGIPTKSAEAAVESIINGENVPVDMGAFGSDNFIYVAGFGNFTALSYSANQKLKNIIGKNAYYMAAVREFFKMKPFHARVIADGEEFEGDYFYGAFSNSYAVGGMPVLHNMGVKFDDGLFELVLVDMFSRPTDILSLASSMVQKKAGDNKLVTIHHCKNVKFMFDTPTSFTLDGEYGGTHTLVEASCLPSAVNIRLKGGIAKDIT